MVQVTLGSGPVTVITVILVTCVSLEEVRDTVVFRVYPVFSLWPPLEASWQLFLSSRCVWGYCSAFLSKFAEYKLK